MSSNRSSSGRASRRRAANTVRRTGGSPSVWGVAAGRYQPLSQDGIAAIDAAARDILSDVGMSDLPVDLVEILCRAGALHDADGRVLFPTALVDAALQDLARPVTLHGRGDRDPLRLVPGRAHVGSGGAAPMVADLTTGEYRPSTLQDLFDAARLCEALDNVHFFNRSLVARDVEEPRALDFHTAYASLAGTSKHVATNIAEPAHVADVVRLCYRVAGGETAFRAAPFLSLNVNHVTPPLRFAPEACAVLAEAVRAGIPVQCNTFGQVGASSPVTLAGALAQSVAETLAGMILAWAVDPQAIAVFGARPMIVDLRTGAMSGGGGEQALVMAATAQMATYYGVPNSTIAGATDAKSPDAQSGYEKALSVALAVQAGSNMVTQACGMQAGLMAASFEGYVIDNDMLGAVLRAAGPLDISAETLAVAEIAQTVRDGPGHFLGNAATYARMQSDYLYPVIADRRPHDAWEEAGRPDIREAARSEARRILDAPRTLHIPPVIDADLRRHFDIRLPAGEETP